MVLNNLIYISDNHIVYLSSPNDRNDFHDTGIIMTSNVNLDARLSLFFFFSVEWLIARFNTEPLGPRPRDTGPGSKWLSVKSVFCVCVCVGVGFES